MHEIGNTIALLGNAILLKNVLIVPDMKTLHRSAANCVSCSISHSSRAKDKKVNLFAMYYIKNDVVVIRVFLSPQFDGLSVYGALASGMVKKLKFN